MKALMYGTAIALALSAGSAIAQSDQIKPELEKIFLEESIELDANSLSDELANELFAAFQGSDVEGEKGRIEQILRDNGYVVMAMERPVEGATDGSMEAYTVAMDGNSLRDQVDIKLDELGYTDIDVAGLSDEQVSNVYLALQSSSDGSGPERAEIDALLQ